MNAAERSLAALLVAIALSACGSEEQESREPPPIEDTVFADSVDAIDKARAVEDTMLQHKQDLDKTMEVVDGGH